MSQDASPPDIYAFEDVSEYLKAWFAHAKEARRALSYEIAGRRLGMNRGHVASLVNGHRKVPLELVETLAAFLGIGEEEVAYLRAMVDLQRARTPAARTEARGRLVAMRKLHESEHLDVERHVVFESWYAPVVAEMSGLPGFRPEPAWVASHLDPPISEQQAAEALALLERVDLQRGGFTSGHTTPPGFGRSYYAQMLGHASTTVDRFGPDQRELQTIVVHANPALVERLREEIRRAVERWLVVSEEDLDGETDRMVCVGVQMFPVAWAERGEDEG